MENETMSTSLGTSLFQNRKFTARTVGTTYSDAAFSIQFVGMTITFLIVIIAVLIPNEAIQTLVATASQFGAQYVLLFLVFAYMIGHGVSFGDIGIKPMRFSSFFFAILFGIGTIIVVVPLSDLFMGFLSNFGFSVDILYGEQTTESSVLPTDIFILAMITTAVLPAVFEEMLMRGIVLNGTRGMGTFLACLTNGLLFSIMHVNPAQTCHTFIIGVVLALIAIRCNSIIPCIIIHFLNNGFYTADSQFGWSKPFAPYYSEIVFIGVVLFVFGFIWFAFIDRKYKEKKVIHSAPFFRGALAGIICCIALWFSTFFAGTPYGASAVSLNPALMELVRETISHLGLMPM